MNHTTTVTADNFAAEVLQSSVPVLVDFWAAWCGPCRMLAPVLEELGSQFAGQAKVAKVNTEDSAGLAQLYRIQALPTLVYFKGGKEIDRVVGAQAKSVLAGKLTQAIS